MKICELYYDPYPRILYKTEGKSGHLAMLGNPIAPELQMNSVKCVTDKI